MGELLHLTLVGPGDVAASRHITCEVGRELGMTVLEQTKLATVVSELARRSFAAAGVVDVTFSLDAGDPASARLIVVVSDRGKVGKGSDKGSAVGTESMPLGLTLASLRRLVDTIDLAAETNGGSSVIVTVHVPAQVAGDPQVGRRIRALGPLGVGARDGVTQVESFNISDLLEGLSRELESTTSEFKRAVEQRVAVNAELALTNRGVLDLITELSEANESLAASGAMYQQLAGQQSALADLGHRAVVSRDIGLQAHDMVAVLRRVLGITAVGVLRFTPGTPSLEVVAADGCGPDQPGTIDLGSRQARNLRRAVTMVFDLTIGSQDSSLLAVPGGRSSAVVPVQIPAGPWGVLVAVDSEPDSFTPSATVFLEAAASWFSFSIARLASEESAQHDALHDRLTGLPNRALLLDYMDRKLSTGLPVAGSDPALPEISVIFLDVDGFKQVNDTVGHVAGDALLVSIGARLRSRTRPSDLLARLGGDEFVAVCEGGLEAGARIAGRLLAAFEDPFIIEDREVFLSGSVGLAAAKAGLTSQQVLADADLAMYEAKQTAGSAIATFAPGMRVLAESASRLLSELRRARERGQLRAVYQPIFGLDDGIVRSVEALLRWHHPDLGDVPAAQAVAGAERIGLAWDFTRWIAAEAAGAVGAWNAANPGHLPLRLAVNFTPLLLSEPRRVSEFEATITASGLSFELVDIELTERAFVDPTPDILASLTELRRLGARLAMDDFGTGYSSLLALTKIPLDILKIDRSFVRSLEPGGDTLLVSAITVIGRGRNLETVGEGIETEGQLIQLMSAGCDLGQGHLFAKPLEREELECLAVIESGFAGTITRARLAALGTAHPIRSVAPATGSRRNSAG